jgi:hypothetical protein
MYSRLLEAPKAGSCFLFGPRGGMQLVPLEEGLRELSEML